ncbi:MAG: V-type ATP synthase subunit D [Oscillospiraceae bacterium]|jgi:V/A-type H+-transporting ATPase subunit D|nr:V-type ATP synthase subunit D [Oscillospiraceae bacterium]
MAQTQLFATKGNLIAAKKSMELSTTGYDLLDRKRSILIREMMELLDRSKELRSKIDETYLTAYAALQRANTTLGAVGDITRAVPLDSGVEIRYRSIMGVDIPVCDYTEPPRKMTYGFRGSDSQLDNAYHCFCEVKKMTVMLTEMENSAFRLARAIIKTQRRANALKNVSIPKLESTIKTITEVLEEKEREEFSRLKVIKRQKEAA